jgi:hypothetical protein
VALLPIGDTARSELAAPVLSGPWQEEW